MEDDPELTLSAGAIRLTIAPQRGGGILRFDRGGVPVMRPAAPGDPAAVALASFPLVPFVNRVRGGRFAFRGREVVLAPNMPPDPSPLHGQGWLARWAVVSASASAAKLVFRHEPGEWPWAYEAQQHFELDEAGLTLALDCTNSSDEPMPCGLGQHPYFLCTPETRLDTDVECAWTVDEKILPVEKVRAEGRYDLSDRRICGQDLDNGFGGWSGRARIQDAERPFAIEISSPEAKFFQVYSPSGGGIFVAEPVSHANAAMNEPEESWAELGLRVLEPGETMRLTMRVDVVAGQ
jgi:aldose 1-epimerase